MAVGPQFVERARAECEAHLRVFLRTEDLAPEFDSFFPSRQVAIKAVIDKIFRDRSGTLREGQGFTFLTIVNADGDDARIPVPHYGNRVKDWRAAGAATIYAHRDRDGFWTAGGVLAPRFEPRLALKPAYPRQGPRLLPGAPRRLSGRNLKRSCVEAMEEAE